MILPNAAPEVTPAEYVFRVYPQPQSGIHLLFTLEGLQLLQPGFRQGAVNHIHLMDVVQRLRENRLSGFSASEDEAPLKMRPTLTFRA